MRHLYFLWLGGLFVISIGVKAQESEPCPPFPTRSPEEEAMKITQMIVRELDITDSLQKDTLYRMHLKYAILRKKSNTRQESLQRMILIDKELQSILTPEQYDRFIHNQANGMPRCCRAKRLPKPHLDSEEQY